MAPSLVYHGLIRALLSLALNTVNGDLHRSKRISSNFEEEIPLIKEKFLKADYSLHFINSVFNEFRKGKECGDESFIIPTSLFEIATPLKFV